MAIENFFPFIDVILHYDEILFKKIIKIIQNLILMNKIQSLSHFIRINFFFTECSHPHHRQPVLVAHFVGAVHNWDWRTAFHKPRPSAGHYRKCHSNGLGSRVAADWAIGHF